MTDRIVRRIMEVEEIPWEDLRSRVATELRNVPEEHRAVIEYVFHKPWPKFERLILDLSNHKYERISKVHEKLLIPVEMSGFESIELTLMRFKNIVDFKSAKVEYYLIYRLLHNRPIRQIAKFRKLIEDYRQAGNRPENILMKASQ